MPFLTPNAEGGFTTRPLHIPNQFLPIVSGQLQYLCQAWNWEQFGDMSIQECVDAMQIMVDEYYAGGSMFLGAYFPWAGDVNELPDYLLVCDGATHSRVDYPALYAVLAAAYQDDADTFHTPNLVGSFSMGSEENEGAEGGESAHTLTVDEMPTHSHSVSNLYGNDTAAGYLGDIPTAFAIQPTDGNTGDTGGSQPHNNLPPYHAGVWVMVAK